MIDEIVLSPFYLYISIGLLALIVGSLLNVIIYRLPIMLFKQWHDECAEFLKIKESKSEAPSINLFWPRSFCISCKKTISCLHNFPIISYILIRGKCANCKVRISIRYPFVEFLSLSLSLLGLWHFGLTFQLVFSLLFIWICICLFFIDLDHKILPDSLTIGLLWLGLIANSQELFIPLTTAIFSAVTAYLFLWILIKVFYLLTGKIGMGNGDFKLFAAFGAWFGWTELPIILLISALLGSIVGIIYLKLSKQSKDTPIPFGPFLCIAGIISMFWGQQIVINYLHMTYF